MNERRRLLSITARAGVVALVVGTMLNLINQGDAIFGGGAVDYLKLALTYAVPFFVSAHGALSAPKR
ncbi:MAG: nitrate/nitrite transporter NrtS [Pseudomonadota bacterium]